MGSCYTVRGSRETFSPWNSRGAVFTSTSAWVQRNNINHKIKILSLHFVKEIYPCCGLWFTGSSVIHKVDGRITLSAGTLLDNLHWHYVTIKRYGRQVNFTVDSQTVTGICNGEFTHLDLDTPVHARAPFTCMEMYHQLKNKSKGNRSPLPFS